MRESPQVKLFGDKVREVGWILTQTLSLTKAAEDFDPTSLLMQTVCHPYHPSEASVTAAAAPNDEVCGAESRDTGSS